MATTTTGRITVVLRAGEALDGRVPVPSGQRAQLVERLEAVGFSHEIREAGAAMPDSGIAVGHVIRILVDSGARVVRGDDGARVIADQFTRAGSGPIDREVLRALVDDVAGRGVRLLLDVCERHEGKLVRCDLLDERLLLR